MFGYPTRLLVFLVHCLLLCWASPGAPQPPIRKTDNLLGLKLAGRVQTLLCSKRNKKAVFQPPFLPLEVRSTLDYHFTKRRWYGLQGVGCRLGWKTADDENKTIELSVQKSFMEPKADVRLLVHFEDDNDRVVQVGTNARDACLIGADWPIYDRIQLTPLACLAVLASLVVSYIGH